MNTKQVEELTGISRQNIRYYERAGLLHPSREKGNAYRDYSMEDVDCLRMIKFLRMLDMPVEEVGKVLTGELPFEDAIKIQKEKLEEQQKLLQGAIEVCSQISREVEKEEDIKKFPVQEYLSRMEYEQRKVGGFAQFKDDYKKVVEAQSQKQFSCLYPEWIPSEKMLEEVLEELLGDVYQWERRNGKIYAAKENMVYEIQKKKIRNKRSGECSTLIIGNLLHPEYAMDYQIPRRRKEMMYGLHMLGRNIVRHKWKSCLNLGICMLVVILISLFYGNISSLEKQYQTLPKSMPVEAVICNETGSKQSGILIEEELTETLQNSKYVAEYEEQIVLQGSLPQKQDNRNYSVLGANRMDAFTDNEEQIQWEEGWDTDRFFKEENVCLADEVLLKNYNLKPGDKIELDLNYYTKSNLLNVQYRFLRLVPLKRVTLQIVGTYQSAELADGQNASQLFVSTDSVREWHRKEQIPYCASAVTFQVKEPQKLNAFKKEMQKEKILTVNPGAEDTYRGTAMMVFDSYYMEAATRLQRSLDLLHSFYPFVMLVLAVAGMIVSYLLIQSRRAEADLMRILGTGRYRIGTLFALEQIFLAVAGCVTGILLSVLSGVSVTGAELGMVGFFLFVYVIGTGISIEAMQTRRISVRKES